ncbi:MAG: GAF domain-containing protein [Candidatus Thermoplasmatota archaeon]|nr:GAF domain-containing protein [Candidatus Thermoplasmatota archaeon]
MASPVDFGQLVEALSDGVLVCSKEGDIVYSNRAFARAVGRREADLPKMNLAKDIIERHLEWRAMVSLLEQGGVVEDYEIKVRKPDEGVAVASVSASLLRGEDGQLLGIGIVFRDISTRKGIESELRDKAFRIDVVNKIARVATAEVDVRRHALVAIASELRKLINFDLLTVGITEENGRHVDVIVPEPESDSAKKSLGMVLFQGSMVEKLKLGRSPIIVGREAGKKQFTELAVMDASSFSSMLSVPLISRGRTIGSLNLFHSKPNLYSIETADMLRSVADQVAGLIDNMVLMSFLEKKIRLQDSLVRTGVELQKAITTQEVYGAIAKHLKEIVDYTDLSFYLVDWAKGMVYPVYAIGNYVDEVLAFPGTLEEGVVGHVAKTGRPEFMDDVDADPRVAEIPGVPLEHSAMLAIPLIGGEGVMGVLEIYRPRGHLFTQSDLDAGMLFAQQASVALANFNLVSSLKEAKLEIELLNDLMFHDINNFNFATLNYIQMIARSENVPPDHRAHLEKSLHLIRQTAELIENVKKLTKIGVMNPDEFVPVDISDVLARTVSSLETSFPDRSISVNMKVPERCGVLANKLAEELFMNLLSNSVKYDPHKEVEIDIDVTKVAEGPRRFWKVCIGDRGGGIPDEKKPLLFQKFVRLKPDPRVPGTGLGLSICRALTDKFGGRIWVEDRIPGKCELGARFCVMLPAAKEPRI